MNNRNIVFLTLGAVSTVLLSYYTYNNIINNNNNNKNEENLEPALTEEETIKIMNNIEEKFKLSYMQMIQYIQSIKAQYMQQGMQIDESELNKALLPQVEKLFIEAEQKVYDEFDVTSDEVEEAVNYYLDNGNSKLLDIERKIKKMYKELGGEVDLSNNTKNKNKNKLNNKLSESKNKDKDSSVSVIEDADEFDNEEIENTFSSVDSSNNSKSGVCSIVTVEQFIGFIEAMAAKMAQFFDGYYDAFCAEYGRLTPQSSAETQQRFQMGMIRLAEEVQAAFFSSCSMTEREFEALLMKHQNDPRVQMAFMQLQYATQQRFQQKLAESSTDTNVNDGRIEEVDEE